MPLVEIIAFMDGLDDAELLIDDYTYMRATVSGNILKEGISIIDGNRKWTRILESLQLHGNRILTQMYGLYSFAKCDVPVASDGVLDFAAASALECICEVADYNNTKPPAAMKAMALSALANLMEKPGGRSEFLSVHKLNTREGEDKGAAMRKYLTRKFFFFLVYLRNIPLEDDTRTGVENRCRGAIASIQVIALSRRGTDLSELACKCLSFLAREEGYRELMSTVVTDDVLRTLVNVVRNLMCYTGDFVFFIIFVIVMKRHEMLSIRM